MVYDKRVEIKKESVCMNIDQFQDELNMELTKITDDFNSNLQKNAEDLIKRIRQEVDNIEDSFDILDNDFNEMIKEACKNDKSHVKELSENE